MMGDLIETFKIINGFSIYVRHFFKFLCEVEIYSQNISETKST